jgi:OmpA-OmpF porin, OOP family
MKSPLRFAVAALLLSAATVASAADSKWYLGFGVGYSYANMYPADFASNTAGVTDSHKYYDAGYKVFMGYQLDRNWALEGSWVTLGKFQYGYATAGGSTSLDYKVTGFGFSLVPSIPLGDSFSVFGKLGVFASQARLTVASANGAFAGSLGNSGNQASEVSPLLGAGFQLDFTQDFGVRLEYENYGKVGNINDSGRAKVQMGSLNAVFKF